MERFYSNHIVKGMDILQALQDAQHYVRDLTSRQVANYVNKCYHSGKWESKNKEFIEQYRENYLKMAKNLQKKNHSSIPIIGQLLLSMEHEGFIRIKPHIQ